MQRFSLIMSGVLILPILAVTPVPHLSLDETLEAAAAEGEWATVYAITETLSEVNENLKVAVWLRSHAALALGYYDEVSAGFSKIKDEVDLIEILSWSQRVSKKYPQSATSLALKGDALTRNGQFENALKVLTEAIELQDDNSVIHDLRGVNHSLLGRNEAAEEDFVRALEIDSTNVNALMNFGILLLQAGEPHSSLEVLSEVIDRSPKLAVAFNARGVVHTRIGLSLIALGIADTAQESWLVARSDFEEALNLMPGFEVARNNLLAVDQLQLSTPGAQNGTALSPDSRGTKLSATRNLLITDRGIGQYDIKEENHTFSLSNHVLYKLPSDNYTAPSFYKTPETVKNEVYLLLREEFAKPGTQNLELRIVQHVSRFGYGIGGRAQRRADQFTAAAMEGAARAREEYDLNTIVFAGSNAGRTQSHAILALADKGVKPIDKIFYDDAQVTIPIVEQVRKFLGEGSVGFFSERGGFHGEVMGLSSRLNSRDLASNPNIIQEFVQEYPDATWHHINPSGLLDTPLSSHIRASTHSNESMATQTYDPSTQSLGTTQYQRPVDIIRRDFVPPTSNPSQLHSVESPQGFARPPINHTSPDPQSFLSDDLRKFQPVKIDMHQGCTWCSPPPPPPPPSSTTGIMHGGAFQPHLPPRGGVKMTVQIVRNSKADFSAMWGNEGEENEETSTEVELLATYMLFPAAIPSANRSGENYE